LHRNRPRRRRADKVDDSGADDGERGLAYYLHRRLALFRRTRPPEIPILPGLHHPKFNFNDDILPLAIAMHVELARRFADDWRKFPNP
jgi:hypothetical protein